LSSIFKEPLVQSRRSSGLTTGQRTISALGTAKPFGGEAASVLTFVFTFARANVNAKRVQNS
ncbi:MAG: hypothetical protein K8R91_02815, partial [Phycisphaerae bacterium]|nr:hypothetical protein [Phycisphaerae bacterium]